MLIFHLEVYAIYIYGVKILYVLGTTIQLPLSFRSCHLHVWQMTTTFILLMMRCGQRHG